jgi:hypothetical protein
MVQASEWDCNEIFECSERANPPPWITARRQPAGIDQEGGNDVGDVDEALGERSEAGPP